MQVIRKDESTAAKRRIPFLLLNTDGTAGTGKTLTGSDIRVSKAGGSLANFAGSVTELGGGAYSLELTAGECDTEGALTVIVSESGCQPSMTQAQVSLGVPANALKLNDKLTDGTPAVADRPAFFLRTLDCQNPLGHGINAVSTFDGYSGIYCLGYGTGAGLLGIGGNGTLGTPATAASGICGISGSSFREGIDTDTGQEWGTGGIRGIGGRNSPGVTCKGGPGGPGLFIFTDGTGPGNAPALRITGVGEGGAVSIDGGVTAENIIRILGGLAGGQNAVSTSGVTNLLQMFSPPISVTNVLGSVAGTVGSVAGDLGGSVLGAVAGLTLGPLTSSATSDNTVTFPSIASFPADYVIGNRLCNSDTNYLSADIIDFDSGVCTIASSATNGNWPVTPDPGTIFYMQFLPGKKAIVDNTPTAASIADAIWDESLSGHSTAGSAGKKLSDLPLSSAIVNAIWGGATGDHDTAGTMGAALNDAAAGGDLSAITDQLDDIEAALVGDTLNVTVVSPLSQNGRKLEIVQGDDYANDDGRAIDFTSASWPTLTSATVSFQAKATPGTATLTKSMTVVTATGTKKVRLELTDDDTVSLTPGAFAYNVVATLSNGNKVTLVRGAMTLLDDLE